MIPLFCLVSILWLVAFCVAAACISKPATAAVLLLPRRLAVRSVPVREGVSVL